MAQPTNDGNIVKRTSQYIDNQSFDETTGAQGVAIYGTPDGTSVYRLKINSDGSINASTSAGTTNYTKIFDSDTTPGFTYIGSVAMGSVGSTGSAIWQIKKVGSTGKTWADGNDSFDNVWDDRASLTYN